MNQLPNEHAPKDQPPEARPPSSRIHFWVFLLFVSTCGAAAGAGGGLLRQNAPPPEMSPFPGAQAETQKAYDTLWTLFGGGLGVVIGVVVAFL